ncbi:hypothetical protein OG21DRAFT_1481073 [Imleria badia]|nr:hypothetical protein OG21DRAFT_1481073 [Imleria badia]
MPRAAVHSFRRFPLSPPDTDRDSSHMHPLSSSVNPTADFGMNSASGHLLGAAPGRTRFQPRRTSTLSYQNSGRRDLHDRSYSRSPRNLVVVIPPPDLPLNQEQLGNVLAMGPRHRLSQGILMPLFPSMFGQLNAIAREYNFPSTVGLCLYLHINENGLMMTPRISDDSWQYLFGHLFDGRPPSEGQQLPIGGSIEFDIDLNKARWFDAWVSGTLRESEQVFPPVVTSQASLEAQWWGESQTIKLEEQPGEDQWNASGFTNSRPETLRNLPKKLSLLDRLELHGVHLPSKSQDHPDSPPTHGTYASSPILQSAIPLVAESDLKRRVNSWKAITALHPVSMAETYQPAPDVGVSIGVTTMDEYALEGNFRKAVSVDDFLWSVSSAGPRSPATESPITASRPSSVHLDRRAKGTVSLIPTTMTSWGPTDDEYHTLVSSATRLPSPDMGERMIEDVMAPRPRAVWGNSFGWRSAMTWKLVYPYSFVQTKPAIRAQLQDSNGLVPQYPNLVIYPTVGSQSDTQSPHNVFERSKSPQSVWGSSFGWQRAVTWRKVYPYSTVTAQSLAPVQLRGAGGLESKYPILCIYPTIHPACSLEEDVSQPVSVMLNESSKLLTCHPTLVIYPAVYPHFDIYPVVLEDVKTKRSSQVDTNIYSLGCMSTLYPSLVIYPAVYPHFDLYPKALQVTEPLMSKEVEVRLSNVSCLTAEYHSMSIYPGAYPYLEIYPTRDMRRQASGEGVAWGISFGWLAAKTWFQVYPLHAGSVTTKRRVDDQSRSISRSGNESSATADIVIRKQAFWGSSFGWKNAATWRAVWPTPYVGTHANVSPVFFHLGQQSDSSSKYPYLVIYPAAYPHIDIYPPPAGIAKVEESQPTKANQSNVNLIPHYPNLIIYPAVYPHLDLYPAFARAFTAVERGKGESNLRRRRIQMWRAKTAAQAGLVELLANNQIWKVDEPLQLDLADYAWSRTSEGPRTSPLVLLDTPSIPGSVHIDRRLQGSVLRTPSTATTWGPQDDGWYSEIDSIKRLPSPDLGQRVLEDVENIEFPPQLWHMQAVFVPEYPHLVIYPVAYPHFELYPTWANAPSFKNQVTETPNSNSYPALDIYPAVYPHFNIYPVIHPRIEIPSNTISNVRHEQVEVRLASLYPNFNIYHACYPYNLDYIYPFVNVNVNATESTQVPIEPSRGYPLLVVYPPVYPFIIPYPDLAEICQPFEPEQSPSIFPPIEWTSVNVKLPFRYPLLDIYSAGYPWSLESIYPPISIDDFSDAVRPKYPIIWIYAPVYPFVQPYPGALDTVLIPGALDEYEYEFAQAFLALSELKPVHSESAIHPYFNLYSAPPMLVPQQGRAVQAADVGDLTTTPPQTQIITRRQRKAHLELHTEVFQDGVVWTPSGYMQDLSSLITRKRGDIPVPEPQYRRPSQDNPTPRPSRSRSGTTTAQSPDKVVFPLGKPPALPPMSPLRVRSPSIPCQPSPAVSETPTPRVSAPSTTYTHMRSTSARLSQAVRSMMPGGQRRNSNAAPASPPPEDYKERAKDRQSPRFLSLVDRRPAAVPPIPPLPHANSSELLPRAPRSTQTNESLVLQRARAYEQSAGELSRQDGTSGTGSLTTLLAVNQSPGTVATKGTHSPFILPPLPQMPAMTEVAEAIEKSKITFA